MGRTAAAASHRFTPSILKPLDHTRRECGRQARSGGEENESCSFREVKRGECKEEEARKVYGITFLLLLRRTGRLRSAP